MSPGWKILPEIYAQTLEKVGLLWKNKNTGHMFGMERDTGIEPASHPWEGRILPVY